MLIREKGQGIVRIYTNGLYILGLSKGIRVGLGAYKDNQDQPNYIASANIGLNQIIYNRELKGVTLAIEYTNSIAKEGDSFKVYLDNQAGLLRLKAKLDNPGQS